MSRIRNVESNFLSVRMFEMIIQQYNFENLARDLSVIAHFWRFSLLTSSWSWRGHYLCVNNIYKFLCLPLYELSTIFVHCICICIWCQIFPLLSQSFIHSKDILKEFLKKNGNNAYKIGLLQNNIFTHVNI